MDTTAVRNGLARIEAALDAGEYRPGPWAALVARVRMLPAAVRRALSDDLSRVSDKLHGRLPRPTMSVAGALAVELSVTVLAVGLCGWGLEQSSGVVVVAAGLVLVGSLQPLVKVGTGLLLGIRYSYAFLLGVEPRFKMRYGTFLAAAPTSRVLLHLSGTVGSPLAAWLVGRAAAAAGLVGAATVCGIVFWGIVVVNLLPVVAVVAGMKKIGPIVLRETSGGAAMIELKVALGRAAS